MRLSIITVAAALTLGAAFAQDSSGVLVPTLPRTMKGALGKDLQVKMGTVPAPVTRGKVDHARELAQQQASACAIRLIEVPVSESIDPKILVQPRGSVDDAMIIQPAVPECPKRK